MNILSIVHGEDAGPELFGPLVAEARASARRMELRARNGPPPEPLETYDAVLVFGGFMHPDQDDVFPWLPEETDWLRGLVDRQMPTLGICLGSELLARATGAWVGRLPVPEIGWGEVELTKAGAEDPVFSALPARFDGLIWHHYAHDLPEGAVALAHSAASLAGVPARHVLGRAVPPRGDGAAARTLDRRPERPTARPRPAAKGDARADRRLERARASPLPLVPRRGRAAG